MILGISATYVAIYIVSFLILLGVAIHDHFALRKSKRIDKGPYGSMRTATLGDLVWQWVSILFWAVLPVVNTFCAIIFIAYLICHLKVWSKPL